MTVTAIDRELRPHASGAGMDRVITRRRLPRWVLASAGAIGIGGAALGLYAVAPRADSQQVERAKLQISPVTSGIFEDFLPLRARVTPLVTVYLDSVEGGRVEKVLVEDGATVAKGQLLAVLSNPELQLSFLARQTEVTQQLNSMRSQELALEQSRLRNARDLAEADLGLQRAERDLDRQAPLAQRGFIAGRAFDETRDNLGYQRRRRALIAQTMASDDRLQTSQLAELRRAAGSIQASLAYARASLEGLNLRAPVAGTLSSFSVQVGQSMGRSERLGQIDSPGRNKLIADVDEFYLGRVQLGQHGTVSINGRDVGVRVTKLYPQVKNGQFQIDLQFDAAEPAGLQRGQTLQAKVTLGDAKPARLIPNGAFYNDTGGNWVFVVTADGGAAVKRAVRLGRRNADYIEVLDGLDPGERVLTSPYTGFADKNRLDLSN